MDAGPPSGYPRGMKTKTSRGDKHPRFPERMTAHERLLSLEEEDLRARAGAAAMADWPSPTDASIGRVPDEGRRAIETMLESRHKAKPRRKPGGTLRVGRRRPG